MSKPINLKKAYLYFKIHIPIRLDGLVVIELS